MGCRMENISPELTELKSRMKATWMAGDFGQVASINVKAGEDFVSRLEIGAGSSVLDVACGTGNSTIPAAKKGGVVTGLDIAPNLLEQARTRAEKEGLSIK